MNKAESIEEFYKRKFDWIPDNLKNELGHFNLFRLEPYVEGQNANIPYKRRDFYKIIFVRGNSKIHYADRVFEVKNQALAFSNPMIPYKWEHLDTIRDGVYCIFNQHFFHQFGQLSQYEVFQPNSVHVFELNDAEAGHVTELFNQMENEFNSDYKYKFDLVRNHIFGLLHFALKMQPSVQHEKTGMNASQRIATLFLELLERQFPIDDQHPKIQLRSASGFAGQLNVHINHLNRAVKEVTQKTTSELISERLLQEAKIMLRHSHWNIADIAFALGFNEVPHFNNFFKKHTSTSPTAFRKQ